GAFLLISPHRPRCQSRNTPRSGRAAAMFPDSRFLFSQAQEKSSGHKARGWPAKIRSLKTKEPGSIQGPRRSVYRLARSRNLRMKDIDTDRQLRERAVLDSDKFVLTLAVGMDGDVYSR